MIHMNRRAFMASRLVAGTVFFVEASGASNRVSSDQGTSGNIKKIVRKGRIKQSVCRWCYGAKSIEDLAAFSAKIGLKSIELVNPKNWGVLKKHGLVCAMSPSHGIVKGLNRKENIAELPEYMCSQKNIFWLLLPALLVFAVSALYYYNFTAEDAFIAYRYAENFVEKGSLVFNPGEPINALTSPLHAFLLSLFYMLTSHTLIANKIVSLILVLLSVLLILRLFRNNSYCQVVIFSGLLACPCVILWTFGGLETPVLMFFITLLSILIYQGTEITFNKLCLISFLAGLAFLTRYDSVLFTVPLFLHAMIKNGNYKQILKASVLGALLPLLWLVISVKYYGDLLPTSFYVKTPDLYYRELIRNGIYVFQYLIMIGFVPFLLFLFFFPGSVRESVRLIIKRARRLWSIYTGVFFMLCYGLTVATMHMMFSFRFFVPYISVTIIILADLFRGHVEFSQQHTANKRLNRSFHLFIVVLIIFQAFQAYYTYEYSVNGIVANIGKYNIGEYKKIGVREYVTGLIPVLEHAASDIRKHWQSLDKSGARPPRIRTFAGGVLPYNYKGAYIYEALVSFRHHAKYNTFLSADYHHIYSGPDQKTKNKIKRKCNSCELISSYTILYNGEMTDFQVYYNPTPHDNRLPPKINDPPI